MALFTPARAAKQSVERTAKRVDERIAKRTANARQLAIYPPLTETAYTSVGTILAWWELVAPSNREPMGDAGEARQAGESSGPSRRGAVDQSWRQLTSLP